MSNETQHLHCLQQKSQLHTDYTLTTI